MPEVAQQNRPLTFWESLRVIQTQAVLDVWATQKHHQAEGGRGLIPWHECLAVLEDAPEVGTTIKICDSAAETHDGSKDKYRKVHNLTRPDCAPMMAIALCDVAFWGRLYPTLPLLLDIYPRRGPYQRLHSSVEGFEEAVLRFEYAEWWRAKLLNGYEGKDPNGVIEQALKRAHRSAVSSLRDILYPHPRKYGEDFSGSKAA